MKTFSLLLIILLLISFAGSMIQVGAAATPTLSNSGGGSWNYYREITLNSGNSLTDYQMLITLDGNNFPERSFSDGSDIRFTDVSNIELDYWIESYDYSAKSVMIWVKVSSIPASSTTKILMYYGNDKASSSSNGDATFMFFDDFTGSTIDTSKWIWIGPNGDSSYSLTERPGWFRIHVSASADLWTQVDDAPFLYFNADKIPMTNFLIESKVDSGDVESRCHQLLAYLSKISGSGVDYRGYVGAYEYPTNIKFEYDGSHGNQVAVQNTAHKLAIRKKDTDELEFLVSEDNGRTWITVDTHTPAYQVHAYAMGGKTWGDNPFNADYDYVFVRKYTSSVPAIHVGQESPVITTPSAPRNLLKTAGDRYVNLNWNAPDDDGGSAITGYNIYRGTTSGGEKTLLTTVGNVLTYTDTTAINNQIYYYQVSAVNSAGGGIMSNEVEATPTSDVTTPSAPQELTSSPGDREVNLNWNAPDDDGGTPVTGYKVYRNTYGGEKTLLKRVGNVLTYTDKNLINNQIYYYQVSAVNSVDEGIMSNEVEATPKKEECDWGVILIWSAAVATIAGVIITIIIYRKRRYGSISTTSSPGGARVFLEGEDKGESPVTLDKIRKGTHIVLFSKSGYSDCEKRVVVNADQITAVHCDLKKPEMKLRLSAEPAEIPADGKSKSVITISTEDENGTPAPVPEDTEIVLETNIGLIDTPVSITAGDVSATSILTSSTAGGTATVRAKSGTGLEGSVAVRFA